MAKIDPKLLRMAFCGYIFITITSVDISNDTSCQNKTVPTSNNLFETIFQLIFVEKSLNLGFKFTKGKHKINIFFEGHS